MTSERRYRPSGLPIVPLRPRRFEPRAPRNPELPRRLFLSAAWALGALALVVPAVELAVRQHDRRAVSRDFACLEQRVAPPAGVEAVAVAGTEDGTEIELDGFGRFIFPAGLTDAETVAALQALAVAHSNAGHGPHASGARAIRSPLPGAPAPSARLDAVAEAERACGIARDEAAPGERYALRAWRRTYAGEPPSVRAERAAGGAVLRSLLALLPVALLFGGRAWWRWLNAPSPSTGTGTPTLR